jgi:butyrate kinase
MASNQNHNHRLLIINPGSTSTKIAVFEEEKSVFETTLRHSAAELKGYSKIWDQFDFRKKILMEELKKAGFDQKDFTAIVGRGGVLLPIPGGTYRVGDKMLEDLRRVVRFEHASNLGAILAYSIASEIPVESFIVDPVCVDELEPMARITGMPEFERDCIFHALNIRAIARAAARDLGKPLEKCNFVIAHMGGGISVCAMREGKVINVNFALCEGPFTPERSGSLPLFRFADMCFSGKYTLEEIKKKVNGQGGLVAYLGTNDAVQVEKMIHGGDDNARLIYEAMAYQVAQEIGARATVLKGKVDAIVITGGVAYSKMLTDWITERVGFIAPVRLYPGEDEMQALAMGGLRVLRGEEEALIYG